MRKCRYEIKGRLLLKDVELSLENLGQYFSNSNNRHSRFHLLNGNDVANRLFMIQLSSEGFYQSKAFYYQTDTERKQILQEYQKEMSSILMNYLKREYHISGQLVLTTELQYDVDCSSLPIETLKAELSTDDLLRLMQEDNNYHFSIPSKKLRGIEHIFGG